MRSHGEPNSFNPNMKTDDLQLPATYNIFNRLVKMTVDNHVVPDLATDWEFSEDGMDLTFNLRENVKWHDGEPFTSKDVVWTFTKVLEEGYQSNTLSMINSVTADGDYKAVFHLKQPDASVISVLSWLGTWIMPAHLYEGTDWTQNEHNMHPIGTGPFKFVKYTPGVSIEMERNEDYWDGAPYLDKLIISIIRCFDSIPILSQR
ncbi:MAG: ABC transporter substrate-binding protein [Holdemania massiliensis]